MKLYDVVWLATGAIALVAIGTQTNIIKNILNKIKAPGQVPAQGYSYGYTPYYGYGPLVQEQYPSHIISQYPEFIYQGTESEPRAAADQQAEDEERLVQEPYPSHIISSYPPQQQPLPLPNQHLCTGECKSGTCDSQGFCIDSGCGSVIRGGSQCHKKQKQKKNNIHPTTPNENWRRPMFTVSRILHSGGTANNSALIAYYRRNKLHNDTQVCSSFRAPVWMATRRRVIVLS